jgi:hypothetical protein
MDKLTSAIRMWVTENPGRKFDSRLLDDDIGVYTSADKNHRWHVIRTLEKEGLVEKYGRGHRVVMDGLVKLDWKSASEKDIMNILLPFDIHELVNILPKNIIALGGEKEAGKTAMCLDFVRLNMNKYNMHYYSSEMGELELKYRLMGFERQGIIQLSDWNFESYERAFDFHDAVARNPNDIHVIDFLEIHRDFYEIAGLIFNIWNKLNKGVAFIAIQKNPGAKLPRGGSGAFEKARLAMLLDRNKLTIEAAKNWKDSKINPRGRAWTFQLVGGCKFVNILPA